MAHMGMPDPLSIGRRSVRDLESDIKSLNQEWRSLNDERERTDVPLETQIATLTNEARTTNQQMQELLNNPVLDQDTVQQGRKASKQATDLIERIPQSRLVATTAPLEERRQTLETQE
jgi:hypothetical protein